MSIPANPIHLPGDPPLEVHWRRSARAKRMALRISRLDGNITLTLPARATMRMAMAFLHERADWMRRAAEGFEGPIDVAIGAHLPIEGQILTLSSAPVRTARIEGAALLVPQARAAAAALAFVKARARDRLADRVAVHAHALGRTPGKLTLRDTRSRWGSCTHGGDLMFSWRLILAPPLILDYVAAHEVAHLAQMNHGPAFWTEVARLFPAHADARRWLKANGASLHRYQFRPA